MKWTDDIKKDYLSGVTYVKIFCALLVLTIHVSPFGNANDKYNLINYVIQKIISRVSVPFFFVSSSYFLFRRIEEKVVIKYFKRFVSMYIIWTLIYIPFWGGRILTNKNGLLCGIIEFFRQFIFEGSYTHLWYLNASIVACVLIYVLQKVVGFTSLCVIAIIFYLMGLIGQTYYGVFVNVLSMVGQHEIVDIFSALLKIIGTTRNGVFFGFPMFVLGYTFAKKKIEITKNTSILCLVISLIMLLAEGTLIKEYNIALEWNMYIMTPVVCFFLMNISLHLQCDLVEQNKTIIEKNLTIFYLIQIYIREVIVRIIGGGVAPMLNDTVFVFIMVFVGTLLTSIIIVKLSITKIPFLKKLY